MIPAIAPRTGAQILVDQLVIQGVDHAFCVPGESYLAVLDALYDARAEIRLVVNRHESGASFMADAYAKLTGRCGVCFVTRGPGATNASIGIQTSFQDSTPVILFVGQVGGDFIDREAFQEIDYRRMFGNFTKWVAQIDRADRVAEYVARAFQIALSGRPGPVVLALPEDMLVETASVADARRASAPESAPSAETMTHLMSVLADAKSPLVLVGGSGWTPSACAQIEQFATRSDLPVAATFRRQDLFDNHHPNYVGDVGIGINPKLAARVKNADVVLAIGARLGEMTTSGYSLFEVPVPRQRLIHVLSGAEEVGRVIQPVLGIQSSMSAIAAALSKLPTLATAAWTQKVREARAEYEAWQEEPTVFSQRPHSFNNWKMIRTLFAEMPANTILANGAGNFATWGHRFRRYPGLSSGFRSQLAPTSGAMGYGVPAGIAAAIICAHQPVVILAGDGDFMMTGQELATAVREGAAPLIIVINNGFYGTIRMHQEREYPSRVHGTDLSNPDFSALARAYGAFGAQVRSDEEFLPALRQALEVIAAHRKPALIEVFTDPQIISPSATIDALRERH